MPFWHEKSQETSVISPRGCFDLTGVNLSSPPPLLAQQFAGVVYEVLSGAEMLNNGRSAFQRAAQLEHVQNSLEGHETGNDRPLATASAWLSFPPSCAFSSGLPGHRSSKVAHGHFCSWLLLASPCWLSVRLFAKISGNSSG
jgi:hypothetical protein